MEMELVPLESIDTPGVNLAISVKSLTPFRSMVSCDMAVALMGTLLRASAWRVAVTMISWSVPPLDWAASGAASAGAAASWACAAKTAAIARLSAVRRRVFARDAGDAVRACFEGWVETI